MKIISPSILAADFAALGRDVEILNRSKAEWIHFDVMDGMFVPNISFGFPVLEAVRKATTKVLDVHLMIVEPERYIERFASSGADWITFHYEATMQIEECIAKIRKSGAKVGISIKPKTDVELLRKWLPMVDMVLVMSVEPGFGGQSFIEDSLERIKALSRMIADCNADCRIEVDGGISYANAASLYEAGAEILVAGSSVFKSQTPEREIEKLLEA